MPLRKGWGQLSRRNLRNSLRSCESALKRVSGWTRQSSFLRVQACSAPAVGLARRPPRDRRTDRSAAGAGLQPVPPV